MKKTKKKSHRSKASKKRHAATKGDPSLKSNKRKPKVPDVLISDISNDLMPTIDERATVIPASQLGSAKEPGWLAIIILRYFNSVIRRHMTGKEVGEHTMIRYHFSTTPVEDFYENQTLIGSGALSFQSLDVLAFGETEDLSLQAEGNIRDFIARMNEDSEYTIKSVCVEAVESDKPFDVEDRSYLTDAGAEIADTYRKEIKISKGVS